jgi:hypothetical protein
MYTSLHMAENENLKPFKEAADNIAETSWDTEQKTPEFKQIEDDLRKLRKEVGERKPTFGLSDSGPLADMAYDAGSALLTAVKTIFEDPEKAANPEKPANTYNQTRNTLLSYLARTMTTLHITPEDLAATLKHHKFIEDNPPPGFDEKK